MIIHSEDGVKYDVQWSIKTIQTPQNVITSDQLNTTGAELGQAQPQLVLLWSQKLKFDFNVWSEILKLRMKFEIEVSLEWTFEVDF